MKNVEFLEKTLTYNEYVIAKELFSAIKEKGLNTYKAVAMIYRCGFLNGKTAEKESRRNAEQRRRERLANSGKKPVTTIINNIQLMENKEDITNE